MQIKTTGIVIRAKNIGEDRLVHILTEELGVISTFAKGAQKPRGRLTSSTELFCYCKFSFFKYKDNYSIDSADCEDSFFQLRNSLETLSLASYIANIAQELAPLEQPAQEYLRLVLNALYLLKLNRKPLSIVKAATELRMLSIAGFMPDLAACSHCGEFKKEHMLFSVKESRLCCIDCKTDNESFERISPAVLAAMRHIIYSDAKKLFSFNLSEQLQKELVELCETYLLFHIERVFKSLEFYRSMNVN